MWSKFVQPVSYFVTSLDSTVRDFRCEMTPDSRVNFSGTVSPETYAIWQPALRRTTIELLYGINSLSVGLRRIGLLLALLCGVS